MRQASADLLNPQAPPRREVFEAEARAAPATHTAWRVLIVDARAEDAAPLAEALRRHGHHVERARNGYAALETYGEADVDIVLLDPDLPDVDGLQVCRQLSAA